MIGPRVDAFARVRGLGGPARILLPAPAAQWDFRSGQLPADLTFSRASLANRLAGGLVGSVASGIARFEAEAGVTGIRLDPARSNLLLHSRDLTALNWIKLGASVARTRPGIDGAANAGTLVTALMAGATVSQGILAAGTQRVASVYLRRESGSGLVEISADDGATWTDVSPQLATARDDGGGYTRVVTPAQSVTNPTVVLRLATPGDAVIVDGVQLEAGSYVTSVIHTGAASVTRAAETLSVATSAIPGFSSVAGTIAVQTVGPPAPFTQSRSVRLDDGTSANRITVGATAAGLSEFDAAAGGVVQVSLQGPASLAPQVPAGQALRWEANRYGGSTNRGGVVADLSAAVPTLTTLRIGSISSDAQYWRGLIARVRYWPQALSDAQLQLLSAG